MFKPFGQPFAPIHFSAMSKLACEDLKFTQEIDSIVVQILVDFYIRQNQWKTMAAWKA